MKINNKNAGKEDRHLTQRTRSAKMRAIVVIIACAIVRGRVRGQGSELALPHTQTETHSQADRRVCREDVIARQRLLP